MTSSHSSKDPLRPPVSGGQFAGAVFTKALDTSLWVLRAKLRNSSSDSAHCMGKSVYSVRDYYWLQREV